MTDVTQSPHKSVMLAEVLAALKPQKGEIYVDGTFGYGGYTSAILEDTDCTVLAIDRDPSVLPQAETLKERYGERFTLLQGCFGDVRALLEEAGIEKVDGFVLDIGVSSMQLDQAGRGFSFRADGPLDMRMDTQNDGPTAADIVNKTSQDDLANIIYQYGEERKSRHVAKAIVEARRAALIERTGQLADIVRAVVPASKKDQIDPATRTFQALRIAVNDELGELERALLASQHILKEGGRLVVVSFHSLEDSIVKHFLREKSGQCDNVSRYLPEPSRDKVSCLFDLPQRKAVYPSSEESSSNPRARSARMRYAVRTSAPAMEEAA